jgi:hypothetical protein
MEDVRDQAGGRHETIGTGTSSKRMAGELHPLLTSKPFRRFVPIFKMLNYDFCLVVLLFTVFLHGERWEVEVRLN